MKYRHLNEISKYFKPVDYIEELTPEEKEKRDLQKYYADNFERAKDFAENFNPETDKITFTFYKTLYQTGEKRTVDFMWKNSYSVHFIYSYVLCTVLHFMSAMLCYDSTGVRWEIGMPELFHDYSGDLSGQTKDLGSYKGISAEIVRSVAGENPDVLTVVYIPDVSKYKDLVCSGVTDTGHVSGWRPFPDVVSMSSGVGLDISFGFILDDMRLFRSDYRRVCSYIYMFVEQVRTYERGLDSDNYFVRCGISPLEALRVLCGYIRPGECTVCDDYRNGLFGFGSVLRRAVSDAGCSRLFREMFRDIFEGRRAGLTDGYRALSGAIIAVVYWGVSIDELGEFCRGYHGSGNDISFLPYVVRSFGYVEYLVRNSGCIESQFNSFAGAVRSCLGFPGVSLRCFVGIPVDSEPRYAAVRGVGELCGVRVNHSGRSCSVPQVYYGMAAYGYASEMELVSSPGEG